MTAQEQDEAKIVAFENVMAGTGDWILQASQASIAAAPELWKRRVLVHLVPPLSVPGKL
jgi:microcompartment protein CcmK/EutM